MNGKRFDDRISAYLDGELSVEERARVDQELAASSELRRELSEYRQVSGLLQELPRSQAPEELRPSVLRAIERETLLPAQPEQSRFRFRVLITTAACAAIAVVAVGWFGAGGGQQLANRPGLPQPEIVQRSVSPSHTPANTIERRDEVRVPIQRDELRIDRTDLTSARVGDVIEALTTDGESVSVIRLTVVDRREGSGLEALQLLLAGENIQRQSTDQSPTSGNGMIAVYVQSDPEKLSAAIESLRQKLEFESLAVSGAVALSELEPEVQSDLTSKDASAEDQATQRTVTLKPGTVLEKLAREDGSSDAKAESKDQAPGTTKKPMRVIFVLKQEAKSKLDPANAKQSGDSAAS